MKWIRRRNRSMRIVSSVVRFALRTQSQIIYIMNRPTDRPTEEPKQKKTVRIILEFALKYTNIKRQMYQRQVHKRMESIRQEANKTTNTRMTKKKKKVDPSKCQQPHSTAAASNP